VKKLLATVLSAGLVLGMSVGLIGCTGTTPAPAAKKDTPAKDTPAKDTPAKDTPAKDTPAKDTPAKDTPAK
jgi:hypothetical protein